MEPRVSLITLGVADLDRAVRFYCDGLGWPRSSIGAGEVAFLRTGGVVLALYPRASLAQDLGRTLSESRDIPVTLAYNVRNKAEVDQVMAQAVVAGATVIKAGHEMAWGGYVGYFADPDGYVWEIAWNPGFPLADDGTVLLPD